MKRETIEKRIAENLMTKKGELMKKYGEPLWWLRLCNRRAYPCRLMQNGSHFRLEDNRKDYFEMLTALGIDYTTGNDSPRGGATGFYIELTAKGKRQVEEFKAYEEAKYKATHPYYICKNC